MKPIIGIVQRPDLSSSKHKINIVYKDILTAIINSGGIPIGIPNDNIDLYLNICKGFIFQGGDDIDNQNISIIKTIKKKQKPILGICLGMQELGVLYQGEIIDIDNHKNNHLHTIIIDKSSLLYKIIKQEKILVNSRHKSSIINPKIKVSSRSLDNVIESIEDDKYKFLLGLQWHPENLYNIDPNSKKIFDFFINICNK